jgi:outer membrane lipoprotein carrier protein
LNAPGWLASKPRMGWLRIIAVLAWMSASPAGAGGETVSDCVRNAVDALQKRYEGVSDLRARFEQTTHSVALGGPGATQTSRGTVVFAKPGKMRWHYEEPEESLVVSDGATLWIYDPAAGEAQKLSVTGEYLSGAAIQFLLGEGDILRDFQVDEQSCGDDEARLRLLPRKPASYETLSLVADPRSGDLRETAIADLLGNVTRVKFQDLKADTAPSDDLFRFEPPAGVEVIELETGGTGE